jgi:hypothetical protein
VRHHIDISTVLRRAVCDLYSNLVTRPTGAAVRREIEAVLAGPDPPSLTVIDFTQVGLLDFSCADEVIGKLLDGKRRRDDTPGTYFLVRGVRDDHLEAIESAMQRYEHPVIVERLDGTLEIVGPLEERSRRTLELVLSRGRAEPADVAAELEEGADESERVLDRLWRLGLVMRDDDAYVSLPTGL